MKHVITVIQSISKWGCGDNKLVAALDAKHLSSSESTNERQPTDKTGTMNRKLIITALSFLSMCLGHASDVAFAQGKKPNILVIWGDDIGIANVSAYSDGLMGYETPNIDRIANEGIRFLNYYGEQSCTSGGQLSLQASMEYAQVYK